MIFVPLVPLFPTFYFVRFDLYIPTIRTSEALSGQLIWISHRELFQDIYGRILPIHFNVTFSPYIMNNASIIVYASLIIPSLTPNG